MEYIAPVSLWLVVCEYDLPEGHVVEAASVACDFHDSRLEHHCESGPILFTSRIHAEVYAHVANTQGAQWTCPRITGHPVTLRLEKLLADETHEASGISGRCAGVTRYSGRMRWQGFATPSWRRVSASTKHNHASSF